MATDKEILVQFLNTLAGEVREALPRVTGKTASSIEVEATDEGGKITAPGWFSIFRDGRKPGKFPPIAPLEAWIRAKGLQGRNKFGEFISSRSFAFAIAIKMKNEGNSLYRVLHGGDVRYNPIRVELDRIFSETRIQSLLGTFGTKYGNIVSSEILTNFKS